MAEYSSEINERVPSPAPDPRKNEEEDQTESSNVEEADSNDSAESGDGAEASRNPYKWDEEAASPTTASGGPTTTDFAEAVSSFAKEGQSRLSLPSPRSTTDELSIVDWVPFAHVL